MSTSLAWIAAMYPQVFDFALVRDRALAERLTAQLAGDEDDGPDEVEPYCHTCGAGRHLHRSRRRLAPLPRRGHRGQPGGAVRRGPRARGRLAPGRCPVSAAADDVRVAEARRRLAAMPPDTELASMTQMQLVVHLVRAHGAAQLLDAFVRDAERIAEGGQP